MTRFTFCAGALLAISAGASTMANAETVREGDQITITLRKEGSKFRTIELINVTKGERPVKDGALTGSDERLKEGASPLFTKCS